MNFFPFIPPANAAGAPAQGFFALFKEQVNAAARPLFGDSFIPYPGNNLPATLKTIEIASNAIALVISFAGLLFFIYLVVAGFRWLTAGGEEEKVEAAQSRIKNAVIGLIIVVCAYLITYAVSYYLIQVNLGLPADALP